MNKMSTMTYHKITALLLMFVNIVSSLFAYVFLSIITIFFSNYYIQHALSNNRYQNRVIGRYNYEDYQNPSKLEQNLIDSIFRIPRMSPIDTVDTQKGHITGQCPYNICEKVDDYPEAEIMDIVKKTPPSLQSFFGKIIEPAETANPTAIGTRIKDSELSSTSLCETIDQSYIPRKMMDVDNIERNIINVGKYTQIVKFQTCKL